MKFTDTKIWKIIKNKYVIAILIFLVLILFIDENNLFVTRSLKKDVSELNQTVDTLLRGIEQDSIQAQRLKDNMDSIERYGREQYYMKRADEDVFIIVHDKKAE